MPGAEFARNDPPPPPNTDPGTSSLRILIADDHPVVQRGIRLIVRDEFPDATVGLAANGQEVLEAVRASEWDVVLLDISMPVRSGLEILPELRKIAPQLRILLLTVHGEAQFALRLLKGGVAGYLTKERAPGELVQAIRKVMAGGKYISNALAERIADALDSSVDKLPHETLSDREFQVMRMLASGLTGAEIAEALSLHVRTEGTFRRHILRKLNLKTTQALVYYAIMQGLVDEPPNR